MARKDTSLRIDTANLLRDLAGIASAHLADGEEAPIVRKALRRARMLQGRPKVMPHEVASRSSMRVMVRNMAIGAAALVAASGVAHAGKIPPSRGNLSYEQGVCDGLRGSLQFSTADHLNVIVTHRALPSEYFGCNSADPVNDNEKPGVDVVVRGLD